MNKRLEYFDLGRFIAICGVILVHTSQYSEISFILSKAIAGFGRFGVQLFFVISGATIFLSFSKDPDAGNFYIKRFFRIVPLFLVMGLFYSYTKDVSFFATVNPLNVFNPSKINVIEGGWSIWNEMYFYLLVPIYFKIRTKKLNILLLSTVVFGLSIMINLRLFSLTGDMKQLSDFDYLNVLTQLSCFVCGIEMMSGDYTKAAFFCIPQIILGTILKLQYFPEYIFVADYGANHWVVMIALFAIALIKLLQFCCVYFELRRFIVIRTMQRLGQLTYTSYMIHFIFIRLFYDSFNLDFGIEINFILISTFTFIASRILQPITEKLPNNLGKIVLKYKRGLDTKTLF
jgi:peptidoglycan/LPS O-acetylase OafA/YrhL